MGWWGCKLEEETKCSLLDYVEWIWSGLTAGR